jgi:hypothetical protein
MPDKTASQKNKPDGGKFDPLGKTSWMMSGLVTIMLSLAVIMNVQGIGRYFSQHISPLYDKLYNNIVNIISSSSKSGEAKSVDFAMLKDINYDGRPDSIRIINAYGSGKGAVIEVKLNDGRSMRFLRPEEFIRENNLGPAQEKTLEAQIDTAISEAVKSYNAAFSAGSYQH